MHISVTQKQIARLQHLRSIEIYKPASAKLVSLPALPKGGVVTSFSFSLTDGVQWRVCLLIFI